MQDSAKRAKREATAARLFPNGVPLYYNANRAHLQENEGQGRKKLCSPAQKDRLYPAYTPLDSKPPHGRPFARSLQISARSPLTPQYTPLASQLMFRPPAQQCSSVRLSQSPYPAAPSPALRNFPARRTNGNKILSSHSANELYRPYPRLLPYKKGRADAHPFRHISPSRKSARKERIYRKSLIKCIFR